MMAAWVAFIVFSAVWAAALGVEENDDLPQELGADDSTTALVFVAVLVCVAAPIAEELFFRGFCFTALRRWIGVAGGAIATGVIFGAIHAGSADAVFLVPLGVFGALLCLLYHRTGSLLPCIVLHALNNALALGVSQGWEALQVIARDDRRGRGGARDRAAVLGSLARASARLSGLGDEALEHGPHPAARVRRAHPVGAVALAQDPLGLLERAVAAALAQRRAGERDRLRARARAAGAWRRPSAASPRARRGPPGTSSRRSPGRGRRLGAAVEQREREPVHERRESPATAPSRACASIARSSTVPSRGCGRMSHHRNV